MKLNRIFATAWEGLTLNKVRSFLTTLGVIIGVASVIIMLAISAGTEAARQLPAHVELDVGVAHQQRLRVGVDGDELDALEAGLDHPVDGIDATATDADDLDDGQVILGCSHCAGLP